MLLDVATQLGMVEFFPLICERSQSRPGSKIPQRWHRICLEACKQSRRAYLPVLHEPATIDQVLSKVKTNMAISIRADDAGTIMLVDQKIQDSPRCYLFIGPEGGFTDGEIEVFLNADAAMINLGLGILRIEAAAVTAIAQIQLIRAQQEVGVV